jgi:AcrR family transcriptional regulator
MSLDEYGAPMHNSRMNTMKSNMAVDDHPARGGSVERQRMRAATTRQALVAAARAIFARDGFHDARALDIAASAGLTRGAMYHHFTDKVALFEVVFREVAAELNYRTAASVASLRGDLWAQVTGAFSRYLGLMAEIADYRRILLIDGPAVFGWERWRDLQAEYVASGTEDALRALMALGVVPQREPGPLASLIQAALNDAALSIAHPPRDADWNDAAIRDTFLFLLESLRAR